MTRKTTLCERNVLGSSSVIWDFTRYGVEVLHQCDKRIKTWKSQKVLGAISFVCRSYGKKLVGGLFTCPPTHHASTLLVLNKLKIKISNFNYFIRIITHTIFNIFFLICHYFTCCNKFLIPRFFKFADIVVVW